MAYRLTREEYYLSNTPPKVDGVYIKLFDEGIYLCKMRRQTNKCGITATNMQHYVRVVFSEYMGFIIPKENEGVAYCEQNGQAIRYTSTYDKSVENLTHSYVQDTGDVCGFVSDEITPLELVQTRSVDGSPTLTFDEMIYKLDLDRVREYFVHRWGSLTCTEYLSSYVINEYDRILTIWQQLQLSDDYKTMKLCLQPCPRDIIAYLAVNSELKNVKRRC